MSPSRKPLRETAWLSLPQPWQPGVAALSGVVLPPIGTGVRAPVAPGGELRTDVAAVVAAIFLSAAIVVFRTFKARRFLARDDDPSGSSASRLG